MLTAHIDLKKKFSRRFWTDCTDLGLLHGERQRHATRVGTRALSCFKQVILMIRWFLDGTRMSQLARDNAIGKSTAYDYLHEGIAAWRLLGSGAGTLSLTVGKPGSDPVLRMPGILCRLLSHLEGVSAPVPANGTEAVVETDGAGVPGGGVPLHLGQAERCGLGDHGCEQVGSDAETAVGVS